MSYNWQKYNILWANEFLLLIEVSCSNYLYMGWLMHTGHTETKKHIQKYKE